MPIQLMRIVFKHLFAYAYDFPNFAVIYYLHFTAYCYFINTCSIRPQFFFVPQVSICAIFITTPNDNVSLVIFTIWSSFSCKFLRRNLLGTIIFGSLYINDNLYSLQLKVSFSSYKKFWLVFSFFESLKDFILFASHRKRCCQK